MTVQELTRFMAQFVEERDWPRYHTPKNLSMSIAIEAAELMECFQWSDQEDPAKLAENPERFLHVQEEISDILAYLLSLSSVLGIDLEAAYLAKMEKNRLRYPPEACKGKDYRKV